MNPTIPQNENETIDALKACLALHRPDITPAVVVRAADLVKLIDSHTALVMAMERLLGYVDCEGRPQFRNAYLAARKAVAHARNLK